MGAFPGQRRPFQPGNEWAATAGTTPPVSHGAYSQRVVGPIADRMALSEWVAEAETERGNDDALAGVVIHKRRGKGDPGDWYVTMTGIDLLALLTGNAFRLWLTPSPYAPRVPVPTPEERARQREAALAWLNSHWTQSHSCPICGSVQWEVSDVLEWREYVRGELAVGPGLQIFPVFPVLCVVCGYTFAMNALRSEVVRATPPPPPPSPLEGGSGA